MIDFTNPQPLYQQIINDIHEQIEQGILKVGDKIGSHQELAEHYQVSLITVKKAIAELVRTGQLVSRVGKGVYVSRPRAEMDYTKTQTLGFVLRDLGSPFFSRIFMSVEKAAFTNRYNLLIAHTSNQPDIEDYQIRHFLELGVNGIIIASMSHQYTATPLIRQMLAANYPFVMVSYITDEDVPFVGTDHRLGGYLAGEHLIKLGYRRLGYINGEEGNLVGELRKQGFTQALAEHGLTLAPTDEYQLQLRGEWHDYESGYKVGQAFVNQVPRAEAIFCYNDLAALGFQKAVLDAGLKVPEDVALVGFDDIKRGVTAPVPLTTIHQPTDEIGELAVKTLLNLIENKPIQLRHILKPTLVVRDSCGAKQRGYHQN